MNNYGDIINMPYKKSAKRPHMSMHERAAQFASFAALSGHSDAIEETARLTDFEIDLDESTKSEINRKLNKIKADLPNVAVGLCYFRPDGKKEGGAYVPYRGELRTIDEYTNTLVFSDGTRIPIEHIFSIND